MKLRKICAAVLCLVLFFLTISSPVYASTFPAAEIQEATAPDITETNESDTIPKESEETSQEETDESRIETNKESQEETDESRIETNKESQE